MPICMKLLHVDSYQRTATPTHWHEASTVVLLEFLVKCRSVKTEKFANRLHLDMRSYPHSRHQLGMGRVLQVGCRGGDEDGNVEGLRIMAIPLPYPRDLLFPSIGFGAHARTSAVLHDRNSA